MIRNGGRNYSSQAHNYEQGPSPESTVPPPLYNFFHFNHCSSLWWKYHNARNAWSLYTKPQVTFSASKKSPPFHQYQITCILLSDRGAKYVSDLLRTTNPNSTCPVTSRHVTTRHLVHEFWQRKSRVVSWRDVTGQVEFWLYSQQRSGWELLNASPAFKPVYGLYAIKSLSRVKENTGIT